MTSLPFSLATSVDVLDPITRDAFFQRYQDLYARASNAQVLLRDDSTLIWNFCLDRMSSPWSADAVISELRGIDQLYHCTAYQTNLEIGLRILANAMKDKYPGASWTQIWSIVRRHGASAIKVETLRRTGYLFGGLPYGPFPCGSEGTIR